MVRAEGIILSPKKSMKIRSETPKIRPDFDIGGSQSPEPSTNFHCKKIVQLPLPRLPSDLPPLLGHEIVSGQYFDAQSGPHQQADDSRILDCRSWPTTLNSRNR